MAMPTVALTGATGFIGRHLLRAFTDKGWQVRALTRRAPEHDSSIEDTVTWVLGSLPNPEVLARLVEGADSVVHCAGAIKALSRDEFFRMNGEGTANLAYRFAFQCATGPDLGCGSGDTLNMNLACVGPLPADIDFTIAVEPTSETHTFDVIGGPCEVDPPF